MSTVSVELRLSKIEDLFRAPDIDPLSEWFEVYSGSAGIDYVVDEVGDAPTAELVQVTLRMPEEAIAEDLTDRVRAGIVRYCDARLRAVEQAATKDRSRGWLMLAFALIVVALLVAASERLASAGYELLSIAAEGLSIAAWVMLWRPIDDLIYDRWNHRLDRRALRTVRDRTRVSIEPLDEDSTAASSAA